jgi:hypothetical protein
MAAPVVEPYDDVPPTRDRDQVDVTVAINVRGDHLALPDVVVQEPALKGWNVDWARDLDASGDTCAGENWDRASKEAGGCDDEARDGMPHKRLHRRDDTHADARESMRSW